VTQPSGSSGATEQRAVSLLRAPSPQGAIKQPIAPWHPPENGGRASRREFLRATARGLALGALGVTAAALVGRAAQSGAACAGNNLCQRCGAFAGCGLPKAQAFRQTQEGR